MFSAVLLSSSALLLSLETVSPISLVAELTSSETALNCSTSDTILSAS